MTAAYTTQFWQRRTNVWRSATSPARGKSYLELEQQLKRREAPMAAVIDRLAPAQGGFSRSRL